VRGYHGSARRTHYSVDNDCADSSTSADSGTTAYASSLRE